MSQIRINSISIRNYRSFGEEQKFIFPNRGSKKPIAIVGYNNAGKTNLINCLLFGTGYKFITKESFSITDFHNLSISNTPYFKIDISSSVETKYDGKDASLEGTHELNIQTDGLYVEGAKLQSKKRDSTDNFQSFGATKYFNIFYINFHTIKDEIKTQKTSWGNLTSFLAKHIKKIVDTDTSMAGKKDNYEAEVKKATDEVLESSELYKFINKIKINYSTNLRNNNCVVDFGLPSYEDIFLQMVFKVGLNEEAKDLIPIDHFGDGYISMFVMAVIQAIAESNTEDKCLFLFEEPESFLHENHQEYFYKTVLCNLAEKGHQVIYTTHSDKMIDIFDTQSIIRIEFDKQTVVKYNKTEEFTPNIQSDEAITYANFNSYIKSVEPNLNKILFSRKVVLVEGPNDILAYKIAIEKEVEKIKGEKYAETYLSFLNMAFIVHHGKATAYLLIDLCKHFGLKYFVINDWDINTNFINELDTFTNENELKKSGLYMKDGEDNRDPTSKGMITINWKLLKAAGIDNIHFNVPKLENVLGYASDDKNSLKILEIVQSSNEYPESFFSGRLKNFLEINTLNEQRVDIVEHPNSEQHKDEELPF